MMTAEQKLEDTGEKVDVIVDNQVKRVPVGRYTVAAFKKVVDVDSKKELERVLDGKLIPLADDEIITIEHKDERFVSHVRRGGSS
jgi:hypothetical protein